MDLQWRRQESEVGGQSSADLGDGSPQQGPGAEPRWGPGAKPPEAEKHNINYVLRITLVHAYIMTLFLIGFSRSIDSHPAIL